MITDLERDEKIKRKFERYDVQVRPLSVGGDESNWNGVRTKTQPNHQIMPRQPALDGTKSE